MSYKKCTKNMYQTLRCALISIVRLNPWSDSLSKQLAKRSKQLALRRCNMHYGHDNIQKNQNLLYKFYSCRRDSIPGLSDHKSNALSISCHEAQATMIANFFVSVYIYICLWQIQAGNAAVRLAAGLPSESRRARASKLSQMSTPPLSGPGPTDLVPAPTVAWVSWIISDSLQVSEFCTRRP